VTIVGSAFRLRVKLRRTAVALAEAVRWIALWVAVLLLAPGLALAQGRIISASTDTRRVTQPLAREIGTLAERGTDLWIAYRLPAMPTTRQLCGGSHVVLEFSTEITIMAKLEGGVLRRLRVFTPECDVDAGRVPLVWLDGVTPDDSANWLAGLVRSNESNRDWQTRVVAPAVTALALQTGDAAVRSLVALAKDDGHATIRSRALMSLAERAGQQASAAIASAVQNDPEMDVKRTAVQALGRLPKDEGVPLLIQVARTNGSADVRREAMQRLGQSNDARAVRFFEEILTK
jgi:hypothetical protein